MTEPTLAILLNAVNNACTKCSGGSKPFLSTWERFFGTNRRCSQPCQTGEIGNHSFFSPVFQWFFSAGEGEPQVVVQAAHHQGGRDQLVEKPESGHLHRQGLKHLPRLLWPCPEGPPQFCSAQVFIFNAGGNSTSEWAATEQRTTEFGGAGGIFSLFLGASETFFLGANEPFLKFCLGTCETCS